MIANRRKMSATVVASKYSTSAPAGADPAGVQTWKMVRPLATSTVAARPARDNQNAEARTGMTSRTT